MRFKRRQFLQEETEGNREENAVDAELSWQGFLVIGAFVLFQNRIIK
jgi:hypothetical protein